MKCKILSYAYKNHLDYSCHSIYPIALSRLGVVSLLYFFEESFIFWVCPVWIVIRLFCQVLPSVFVLTFVFLLFNRERWIHVKNLLHSFRQIELERLHKFDGECIHTCSCMYYISVREPTNCQRFFVLGTLIWQKDPLIKFQTSLYITQFWMVVQEEIRHKYIYFCMYIHIFIFFLF